MKATYTGKLKRKISFIAIIAVLIIGIQSCVKDNFKLDKLAEVKWDPNIAAPLVYSTLSIEDMLANTDGSEAFIEEDSDKKLTIVYKTNLASLSASEIVNLPNQNFASSVPVGAAAGLPAPFPSGTFIINNTMPATFNTGSGGPLLDSVTIKNGSLYLSFSSDLHNDVSIVATIPNATKNGVPFTQTISLAYTGAVPVVGTGNFDLKGYTFDMTNGVAPYNEFNVNFDITITGSATPIGAADQIGITMLMNSLEFTKAFGYFGNLPLSIAADTTDLSLFTTAAGAGNFSLSDPSIKVTISNSYGMPIDAHLTTFQGYNPGVNFYPITGVPDPLPIFSPDLSQVGQKLTGSFILNDSSGSNIATIINDTPKEIIIKLDAGTNAAGPTQNNFILDTSSFDIDVEVRLPLSGTAINFVLMDSIPFEFNDDIPEQVESGLIRLSNTNGFPLDMDIQVYFVDSQYRRIDSLVTTNPRLARSGIVDATGRVTSPTVTVYDIELSAARFNSLKKAENLIIKATVNTTNGGNTNVTIYSDYSLGFKLGAQAQLHVDAKNQ